MQEKAPANMTQHSLAVAHLREKPIKTERKKLKRLVSSLCCKASLFPCAHLRACSDGSGERSAVDHNPWFLELHSISGELVPGLKSFQHHWKQVIIMECTWPEEREVGEQSNKDNSLPCHFNPSFKFPPSLVPDTQLCLCPSLLPHGPRQPSPQ